MSKRRKLSFAEKAVNAMKQLDAIKYESKGAQFDAVMRAQNELAKAAGMRTAGKRRKSLDEQIAVAEQRAFAKEATAKAKEAQAKKRRASAKKRRDAKKAA